MHDFYYKYQNGILKHIAGMSCHGYRQHKAIWKNLWPGENSIVSKAKTCSRYSENVMWCEDIYILLHRRSSQ